MDGMGRECGRESLTPSCKSRKRHPASIRASLPKGGVLISPLSQISGFSSRPFTKILSMSYLTYFQGKYSFRKKAPANGEEHQTDQVAAFINCSNSVRRTVKASPIASFVALRSSAAILYSMLCPNRMISARDTLIAHLIRASAYSFQGEAINGSVPKSPNSSSSVISLVLISLVLKPDY